MVSQVEFDKLEKKVNYLLSYVNAQNPGGGEGAPSGSDGFIQFITDGELDSSTTFQYDDTLKRLFLRTAPGAANGTYMTHDPSNLAGTPVAAQGWRWFVNHVVDILPGIDDLVYYQGYNVGPTGRIDASKPAQLEAYEQRYEIAGFSYVTEHWWGHTNIENQTIRPMYHIRSWSGFHSLFDWTATSHNWYDDQATAKLQMSLSNTGLDLRKVDTNDPILRIVKPAGSVSGIYMQGRNAADNGDLYFIQAGSDNSIAFGSNASIGLLTQLFDVSPATATPGFAYDRFNAKFVWRDDTNELTVGGASGANGIIYTKKVLMGPFSDSGAHFAVASASGNTYAYFENHLNNTSFPDIRISKTKAGAQPSTGENMGQLNFNGEIAVLRGEGSASATGGGLRCVDLVWRSYNAAGTNAERLRLTAEGALTVANGLTVTAGTISGVLASTVTGTTASAGDNDTSIATTAFVQQAASYSNYRTLLQGAGSITAGVTANTFAIPHGEVIAVTGTGTAYPIATIRIASADYPNIDGKTAKLRIRAQLYTNDVAPTGNFTFGLYPITRPATSGGAGVAIYTLGTVVSGSNGASFTTPAADGLLDAVGSDFSLPSDGHYCLGVVTTSTIAASAHVHMVVSLQIHHT